MPARPPANQPEDPTRATLLQILRELNKSAETASNPTEAGLELKEIRERLEDFWAVKKSNVNVPLLLGMLVKNEMVTHDGRKVYSWVRQRDVLSRYNITIQGKEFLRQNVVESGRIS